MFRLSDELANILLQKIKNPEIITSGDKIFTFAKHSSLGLIDPLCAIGTDHEYSLECPIPVINQEIPYPPISVKGYFLYSRNELLVLNEPWLIYKVLIDPSTKDYEEQIDVSDCSVVLPSDIDKLTAPTITTVEQLITKVPLIMDCLNLGK